MTLDLVDLSVTTPDGQRLFPPLNLSVGAGEVATVMGPSGVGKSTLLDAIGGHLARGFRMTGSVRLEGRDIGHLPAEARRVGLVFQDAVLFPHLSLGDNLAFGLVQKVKGRAARRAVVDQALDRADLGGLYDRDPAALSGGQRARAALMRSILADPLVLLLDEPFSRLDASLRADIRAFAFERIRHRRIPALLVTHDPSDAVAAGGSVTQLAEP